jgi:U3 small nucleolar RNA-associated protein 6
MCFHLQLPSVLPPLLWIMQKFCAGNKKGESEAHMADKIQTNMERMIPELEDYRSRGIFSPTELEKIVETRRKYELRLQRPDKKLLDFVRYIKSECTLEQTRDRRLRQRKADASLCDKYISRKIVELYRSALYRFGDSKIITQFTQYVMKKRMYGEMKSVFAEHCSRNPNDVDLWIYCANKLFEADDVESARAMFLKGLRMNSRNLKIRIELFKMEIRYVEKIEILNREMGLGEEDKDEVERGEIAFAVFLDYYDCCRDEEGLREILEVSSVVGELRERIESYIKEKGG